MNYKGKKGKEKLHQLPFIVIKKILLIQNKEFSFKCILLNSNQSLFLNICFFIFIGIIYQIESLFESL